MRCPFTTAWSENASWRSISANHSWSGLVVDALAADLGADLRVGDLHPEMALAVFLTRWGESKANTWNTRRNIHLREKRGFAICWDSGREGVVG